MEVLIYRNETNGRERAVVIDPKGEYPRESYAISTKEIKPGTGKVFSNREEDLSEVNLRNPRTARTSFESLVLSGAVK